MTLFSDIREKIQKDEVKMFESFNRVDGSITRIIEPSISMHEISKLLKAVDLAVEILENISNNDLSDNKYKASTKAEETLARLKEISESNANP